MFKSGKFFPNALFLLIPLFLGCSKSVPPADEHNPPSIADLVSPLDQSTINFVTQELEWAVVDPEDGTLRFDVYFGIVNPPPRVSEHQSEISHYLSRLEYEKNYYWRIVTWDADGDSSVSPIWSFATSVEPHWEPLGSQLEGIVIDVDLYQGQLVVGGYLPSVNHLAAWDGSSWQSIGGGVFNFGESSANVEDVTQYKGMLVVGGFFNRANTTSSKNCAIWDGGAWSVPTLAFESSVYDFLVHGDMLYASSSFRYEGGEEISGVAGWDATNWSRLGSGFRSGQVWTLAVFNGKLLIGGDFGISGNIHTNVAALDGDVWNPLGDQLDGEVEALCVYKGMLVAGGSFAYSHTSVVRGIAVLNENKWMEVGGGTNGTVYSLLVYKDRLFVGGEFTRVGNISVNNIAVWDGRSWSPLGAGVNDEVRSMVEFEGNLIVGGDFNSAGTSTVESVARWGI